VVQTDGHRGGQAPQALFSALALGILKSQLLPWPGKHQRWSTMKAFLLKLY